MTNSAIKAFRKLGRASNWKGFAAKTQEVFWQAKQYHLEGKTSCDKLPYQGIGELRLQNGTGSLPGKTV
jgi:hypothetical protein